MLPTLTRPSAHNHSTGDHRVQEAFGTVTSFADKHKAYFVAISAFAVQAGLVSYNKRSKQRKIISTRLQDRAYKVAAIKQAKLDEMTDLGLGDGLSGMFASKGKTTFGEVEVQWGREKIVVPLPPPNSPLSSFKDTLYNITGVPPSHMKLIYSGGLMKDDLAPLGSFGLVEEQLKANASDAAQTSFWDSWSFKSMKSSRKLKKIVMLGSKDISAVVDDRLRTRPDLLLPGSEEIVVPKAQADEPSVIKQIQQVADEKLNELEPMIVSVEDFIQRSNDTVSSAEREPPNPRALVFVSEALLQSLLKLDSIEIPSTYMDARAERKKGVKALQAALDKVDGLKEEFKSASNRLSTK
ncbi:hypothetical protein OIO90_001725 [Microbotryomycetes sp. JL221]|nr:hypothetical protein OIO90_001725 [Microbotryomycetes sp. JL221]